MNNSQSQSDTVPHKNFKWIKHVKWCNFPFWYPKRFQNHWFLSLRDTMSLRDHTFNWKSLQGWKPRLPYFLFKPSLSSTWWYCTTGSRFHLKSTLDKLLLVLLYWKILHVKLIKIILKFSTLPFMDFKSLIPFCSCFHTWFHTSKNLLIINSKKWCKITCFSAPDETLDQKTSCSFFYSFLSFPFLFPFFLLNTQPFLCDLKIWIIIEKNLPGSQWCPLFPLSQSMLRFTGI